MEELFLKLVNMSITASWLVLAVILFRILLKNAPKYLRVALWGLVGLRLALPFSFESVLSLIPSTEPLPEEFLYAATPQINSGIPAVNNALNPIIADQLDPGPWVTSANPTQIWSFIFARLWLIGLALMIVYAVVSFLIVQRKVGPSIPVDKHVRLCDNISTPFILGIFRPKIYLPSALDEDVARHVLAHEYAHIKRKDHWWKPLGYLLLCVYWFNPVMWLAYVLLCRDIEMACDEKVVKELDSQRKKAYSAALLQCSVPRRMIAACPLAFGEVGVKDRIRSVLNYRKPAFWVVAVAVVASAVVAVCFMTDPKNDRDTEVNAVIEAIQNEDGYSILNQAKRDIRISISKSVLPDSIYSAVGHTFEPGEVVVYETGTTVFYLDSIRFANEGDDLLYFKFGSLYTSPEAGTVTLFFEALGDNVSSNTLWVKDTTITDDSTAYTDAVFMRGVDGIKSFTVYVDTEVCKAAVGNLNFTINNFNDLTYAKEGTGVTYEELIPSSVNRLAPGDYITTELVYWPLYSSYHWETDPAYRYMVTEDGFYSEYEGETFPVAWKWRAVSQAATELLFFYQWYETMSEIGVEGIPPLEASSLYQRIDSKHHIFKIGDELYLVEGSQTGVDMTNVSAIYKLAPYDDTDVPLEYPDSANANTISHLYSTISGQIYDSRDGMNAIIRDAVFTQYQALKSDDVFYGESHQILSEMIVCGVAEEEGQPCGSRVVEVVALLCEFQRNDSGIVPSLTMEPQIVAAKITMDEFPDGTLKLSVFDELSNEGPTAFNGLDTRPYVQVCYDQAVKYWGVNTDLMVDDLLDTISSSPAQYSNAQPYIEAHFGEYSELLHLGQYTLTYCFNAFLNNQASGIRAEIMAAACREIGNLMGEDIAFDGGYNNGPTWFEAFYDNAMKLYEADGLEPLAESNPVSWVLLNILGQTAEPIQQGNDVVLPYTSDEPLEMTQPAS